MIMSIIISSDEHHYKGNRTQEWNKEMMEDSRKDKTNSLSPCVCDGMHLEMRKLITNRLTDI